MEKIKTVEIHDKVFEETYTAHIQRNGTSWLGWIPEVSESQVRGTDGKSTAENPRNPDFMRHFVAEEEAWEKKFEEDVKAGRLDHLAEKASKNYREGKYRSIEELQKLL